MRYPSIDILRTLALFVMVLVHFGENLSGFAVPFTGFGAPLFAFLSGASYRLWSFGQEAKGKSELEIDKISIRRGLFVFGVGFAFNILVWLPEDTFNWDVLTLIGSALILLNFARKLPLPISVLVAVGAVLVSPILRMTADYEAYWVNKYFEYDLTLSDVTIGYLATGYFPIFPWIAFSLTGFVAASLLFADVSDEDEISLPGDEPVKTPPPWPLTVVGAGLLAISVALLLARPYLTGRIFQVMLGGWRMFPPTTEYVLGTLGMTLVVFGAAHRWIDSNPRALRYRGALDVCKTFSRHSFTIYIVHHVVHLYPMWIYATALGYEPTYYWTKAMPATYSLPLALVFMAVCYVFFRWVGPQRNFGIESWMRWLCD